MNWLAIEEALLTLGVGLIVAMLFAWWLQND